MLRTITDILQTCKHRNANMYKRALIAKMKYKMQIVNTYHAKLHRVTNTGSFSINWAFAIPMKKTPQPDDEGNQVNKIKKIYNIRPRQYTAGNTCKSTYSHYLRQGHRKSWSSSSPSQLPGISPALVRIKMSNNVTTENIKSIDFQVPECDKTKKLLTFFAFCVKQTIFIM